MKILVLQETDWLNRGPHPQHHIFERLSRNTSIRINVIDYDIDKILRSNSIFIKKHKYHHNTRTIKNSNVEIIRTAHIQAPYLRRISSLITNFFEILKIIKRNRPDIIVGYSISNGFIGLLISKLFKIPYIFHYIDILHELVPITQIQPFARIFTRLILKHSDKVIAFNKFQQKYIVNEGASRERIKILPNGVSLENTNVDPEKLDELKLKFSISDNDFVIFFMGYLYEFAGLKEIIDYFNVYVNDEKIKLKFMIVGDGGIYNELMEYIKEIGAEWVILTGRVPYFEISEYIGLADLCLLSFEINDITREIMPIKILEYMAMKKPVLSNKLPGVFSEIGQNHGVIYAKNQNNLIKKIGDLIHQRKILKDIGREGYNYTIKKYLWSKIIEDFKKLLIDSIESKK